MVGDGINDSAVLAQADLGIAMGQGSDIAIDVEKVTILSSDLTKIAAAVRLSAATVRTVRQNLFWAFIYNIIGIPVAAGVFYLPFAWKLNPMIGAAGISAFPMSGRVVNKMGLEEDNQNFLLMYSISVNVSGQIASVIAGGLILTLLGA